MKPINFINSVAPSAHRSMRQYMQHTFLAIIGLCTFLASITWYQCKQIQTIKEDLTSLAHHQTRLKPVRERQQQLMATAQELQTKIDSVTTLRKKQPNAYQIIQALHTHKPSTATLHAITLHGHEITCTLQCKEPRTIHTYLQTLIKTHLCNNARITEIRSSGRAYHITVQLSCYK